MRNSTWSSRRTPQPGYSSCAQHNENTQHIGGHLIAEFNGVNGTVSKEYIYASSGLVATIEPGSNGTRYLTADYLGSPRVVTNSSAGVVSRHDFMPFGESLGSGIGGRTIGAGFGVADGLREQFTSKERDSETGLDYFASRYFASAKGRFTSADSLVGSLMNPQTLNRYSYVGNNPTNFIDPTGHVRLDPPSKGDQGGYWTENSYADAMAWQDVGAITSAADEAAANASEPEASTEEGDSSPIIFTSVELLTLNEQNAEKLRSADFTEPVESAFTADLNVEKGTQVFDATNPANFTLRVNYKVAPHPDIAKVGEDSATRVVVPAPGRGQFRHPTQSESYVPGGPQWYSYEVKGDKTGGTVYIRLRYTGQADGLDYIRVTVSGSYQSGERFRSTASVHLTRNKK